MRSLFITLLLAGGLSASAHIGYIHTEKIAGADKYAAQLAFLKKDYRYYNHWEPQWRFPVSKDSLVRALKDCYRIFSSLRDEGIEQELLTGEIAHYLYNLDVQEYFEKAESAYQAAIRQAPDDYRGHWFLGKHYSLSNVLKKSVDEYDTARGMLPAQEPADFWEEYGTAMLTVSMPSHCLYAMDKVRRIDGKPGYLEKKLGDYVSQLTTVADLDSNYKKETIWRANKAEQVSFFSRMLGIRLSIDSSWGIQLGDYNFHQSFAVLKPPVATAKNGKKIGYTIAVIIHAANPGEKLEDFIGKITKEQGALNTSSLTVPYKKYVSYEIQNATMYSDRGGSHFHIIGIDQEAPSFPGMAVEMPLVPENGEDGKLNYYQPGQQKSRLSGRIFYAVLLDTCADIYEESFRAFQAALKEQFVFE